ncbi:MAG TPA: DUF6491 family protein [Steroidobacteraceae bacterium]|nr:DUF6491 family protein [Steroidobacteraceae bacterium]
MSRSGTFVSFACAPVAAALLASCAGTPLAHSDTAMRASYMAHAGKPVDRLEFLTSYRRSSAISSDQIVVWTDLNRAYLVTVFHPCANLWFAHSIGFTQTGDSVYAHLNQVKADGWTCSIKTIQPVDYRGMQEDLRRQRQATASTG